MTRICDGRVTIITGAGRGIGREHALEFARQGASVVVNDFDAAEAESAAKEINASGGAAVASSGDVADWAYAQDLIRAAVDEFGKLDVLVNNAGFVRDRMLVSMNEQEWDDVVRVHLKGHFAPLRHAAAYWRDRAKAGEQRAGRIINTSSGAGLLGSVGQGNYGAAKGGIASLTLIAAAELGRYGVTANAIAPAARTRMTQGVFESMVKPETGFDAMDPANVSPLVVWLGSTESGHVSGKVFEVEGGVLSLATGWRHGARIDNGSRWNPVAIGSAVDRLIAESPVPEAVYGAG